MHRTGGMESTPPTDIPAKELMSRRLLTIGAGDTVALASQMMLWSGIRHLPVLEDGDLVGVLSDRDILRVPRSKQGTLVREIMSTNVETVSTETPVSEAAARMALAKVGCLPVLRGRRVCGILTTTDMLAERGRLVHKGGPTDVPRVERVMRTRVVALAPTDDLHGALERTISEDVRHFPVVDSERRVVGVLSDRDLRAAVGDLRAALHADQRTLAETRVGEIMTPSPITVGLDASILEVADAFIDERVGAIPVVDAGQRLIGIVSYVDVLAYLVGRPVD